ncbi:pseudouridine synthase [Betaproteobacteria bacterium GR16-43]|nr:pseudouridine synthase [Betaproteobacteria bacterium GR16-43]
MPLFRLLATAFLAFAFLEPALAAPALPAGATKVASVEGITEYRLSNGLKVLLFPDASKPTITVNVTYLVGSRQENYGETGMAHLLEHLMFKGTKKNPDIDKQFNQRGVRYNGTTWLDRTNYYELFQATDDNLRWAIELEADRMVNSFIRKSDLDSEMTVVRNEYEMGENSPFGVMLKRMQSVSYDWHSYGRSTIGNRSDIENVKIANLQAYYRMYYQPDNAVLLVAGKFDEAKTLAMIVKAFGPIPKPKRVLPVLWTREPTQDGERSFIIRRKGDLQIVMVAYKVPSNLQDDADGISFANFILTDTPSGRLHKALVDTGKAAQVFGYPLMGLDPGLHIFGAVVKLGDPVEPVRDELVKVLEAFGKNPPTAEEIERARKNYANQFEKTLNNHETIGVQLSEYIALGDWRLFFLSRDDLPKVTPATVAKAAEAYYRRDNRIVGLYLPEDNPQRAEIPPAPAVADVMKDFKGKAAVATSEAFEPTQANIEARTKRYEFGGVKVALLPKKNRGEVVNVSLALRLGNEKDLFGQKRASQFAGGMLMRGTTKYTREQLADEFEKLKVSGGVSGPGASMQTTRENLDAALRLAVHVLREPAFPEKEFEQLKRQTVTGLQAQLSEPQARAGEALSRIFNGYPKGDWRYSSTLEESIEEAQGAKLEDAKAFHRAFYGASVAEVSIVGDFDEAKAAATLKELLEGWKSATPYARIDTEYRDVAATNRTVETPDKENATLLARINVPLRDDDPDFIALYVANYIFGGGASFDSRLGERIRQKEGLSYGTGSDLSVRSTDRAGAWIAYAIAAPQNVSKVEAAMREELDRARKDGFTEAELANAKTGILQMRVQNRAQDATVAAAWVNNLNLGRTWAFSKQFEDKLAVLKLADVNAALRKYIDPAKLSVVKAGDFTKK